MTAPPRDPEPKTWQLHPQVQALLEQARASGAPPLHLLSPQDARASYKDRARLTQPDPPPMAAIRDLVPAPEGPSVPIRLYRPACSDGDAPLPLLVFFHGGGFVIGDLDTHDVLCRQLANGAGCAVASVGYRLAPESPFPAAIEDCLAATAWLHDNAAALGLDAARIAVGGDSAGATLAAVVGIHARDAGLWGLRFQLLIYPVTDFGNLSGTRYRNGTGYALTDDMLAYFLRHYVRDKDKLDDWRVSPLLARELSGLPEAMIITAGFDPLHDEGLAYAQRLSQAGTKATHICFSRQIHGFITMGRVIYEANAAVTLCCAALREALMGPRSSPAAERAIRR